LRDHYTQITKLVQLKAEEILLPSDVENRIPKPLFQLYNILSKIVIENGIIKEEENITNDKIELIVRTTIKLQRMLID
jgi:hypothetical protein